MNFCAKFSAACTKLVERMGNLNCSLLIIFSLICSTQIPLVCFQKMQKSMTALVGPALPRISLPSKPHQTVANLRAEEGYAEMGTRFKASHIKALVWWLARESQIFADSKPNVPCLSMFGRSHGCIPSSNFWENGYLFFSNPPMLIKWLYSILQLFLRDPSILIKWLYSILQLLGDQIWVYPILQKFQAPDSTCV